MKSKLVCFMCGNPNCEDKNTIVFKTHLKPHKGYLLEEMESPNTSQHKRKGIELEQVQMAQSMINLSSSNPFV